MGNKEDLVTFIDVRSHKIQREEQFKFEVIMAHWALIQIMQPIFLLYEIKLTTF